jgi:hypothetical protein
MKTRILAVLALSLTLALPVHAATNSWIDGTGKWETATNWSLGFAPSTSDAIDAIANASNKTITIDATTANTPATMTINNLTITGTILPSEGTNTLSLVNAGTTTPLNVLNNLKLGANGALTITNSALSVGSPTAFVLYTSNNFILDGSATRPASLRLDDGLLTVSNTVAYLGDFGAGQLLMNNGTFLGRNLVLGYHGGTGTLTVNAGHFELAENIHGGASFVIGGASTNGFGAVWINGGDVVLTNNFTTFIAGNFGSGQMTVSNGHVRAFDLFVGANIIAGAGTFTQAGGTTEVTAVRLSVGYNPSSTGTVWVTGGQLLATNEFTSIVNIGPVILTNYSVVETLVGGGGVGRLVVSNGNLTVGHLTIVSNATATSAGTLETYGGSVTILNSNSLDIAASAGIAAFAKLENTTLNASNASVTVGDAGIGSLTLSNVTGAIRTLTVAAKSNSTGSVRLDFVNLSVFSNLVVAAAVNSTGTFIIVSNSTVVATNGTFGIGNDGTLGGTGGVAQVSVSDGVVDVASVLVGDNFGSDSRLVIDGTGRLRTHGGLLANGIKTTVVNGGTLEVTDGPAPAFEDPILFDRIVMAYLADGRMIVSNGTVRTPGMIVAASAGNTGTLNIVGGTTSVYSNFTVGWVPGATGIVTVTGGALYCTNGVNSTLEVRNGTFTISAGTFQVDRIVLTNANARLLHTGGTLLYTTLVLSPNLSAAGDGIPNGWKQQYGLDPFDPALGSKDSDGDGMNNLAEYQAGTDPTAASSTPFVPVSILPSGNNIVVTWKTAGGVTNQVQVATNAIYSTNGFVNLSPQIIAAGSGLVTTNYTDLGGATNVPSRYYRIRLVP